MASALTVSRLRRLRFAPAIDPRLVRILDELDDGDEAIAELWRALGRRARRLKLLQPSYERVRQLVHLQREARRLAYSSAKRALILTAEFLLNTRNRKGILLDAFDGGDVDRRRELYRRRE